MTEYEGYFRSERGLALVPKDLAMGQRWFAQHWRVLGRLARLPPKPRVLEVGSGLGVLRAFLPQDADYIGLELDPEAVRFAREHFPTATFLETPIEEFYDDGDGFDVVVATEVLEHLENPSAALRRIHDLLNAQGRFVGTTPPPVRWALRDPTHLSVLEPENWRRLFARAGLDVEFMRVRSFVPALWRVHPALNLPLPVRAPLPGVVVTTFFCGRRD
jgi:2-polyprenyl-3-methyl-5-hydroxy-6-metoxy-1,4-benzoquinol methylase